MKAINAPVRGRTVWYDLDHAKIVGAQAAEKRFNRRTERARLKISLYRRFMRWQLIRWISCTRLSRSVPI
jgi:hypothetical protein